jgi:hypothetical protein
MTNYTYTAWVIYAMPVFCVAAGVTLIFAKLFYQEEIRMLLEEIRRIMGKNIERSM